MLNRILCWYGHHMWSDFVHRPSRCVDERFCKSCRKTEVTLQHSWGKWNVEFWERATSFEPTAVHVKIPVQTRMCINCGLRESNEYWARKIP